MTLSLPSTREEAWRWADLSALPTLADAKPKGGAVDVSGLWLGCGGPRLLFVDGVLDAANSDVQNVTVGTVDATSPHALAKLATGAGWSLTLGKAHSASATIEIIHVATGGANHVPARISLAEDAQASIVESYVGDGWANRLTRISLGRSARLMRAVRLLQATGFVSLRDEVEVAEAASFTSTVLAAGGLGSRIDAAITLNGKGAFAEYGGALLARDEQRHDAAIVLRHAGAGGMSQQIWRTVADNLAQASVAARVEVARDAQKTDAEQSLKGMLLVRTATVNFKPELEIFADDVKCAHGATVGELDRNALFYMQSRGIPAPVAQALLTRAFVDSALDRIGEEKARDAFEADADAWLEAGHHG